MNKNQDKQLELSHQIHLGPWFSVKSPAHNRRQKRKLKTC